MAKVKLELNGDGTGQVFINGELLENVTGIFLKTGIDHPLIMQVDFVNIAVEAEIDDVVDTTDLQTRQKTRVFTMPKEQR